MNLTSTFRLLTLSLITIFVFHCQPTIAQENGDFVDDTSRSIELSSGEVIEVFKSRNGDRYYVAPKLTFGLVQQGKIAKVSSIGGEGLKSVEMRLEIINPIVRAEVASKVSSLIGRDINIADIGNLRVNAIIVDVQDEGVKSDYGVITRVIPVPAFAKDLPISFRAKENKINELVNSINSGGTTLLLSYAYNNVNLDTRTEELRASRIVDTNFIRQLDQQGQELMSAKQMSEGASRIKNEITSKVIEGFGKIEPQSIPVETLINLFAVKDLVASDNATLQQFEQRLARQFDLNIDPSKFQPLRIQKKVTEILNSTTDVATQRFNYAQEYNSNKNAWDASANLSVIAFFDGGFLKGGADSDYSRDAAKVTNTTQMSDDQFREMVKKYHGVEYVDEITKFRGIKIYDVQKIKNMGETIIKSVTVKPTLTSGIRYLPYRQNASELQQTINDLQAGINPIGTILPFAGKVAPAGWLICNGDVIDLNKNPEYRALANLLGTTYDPQNQTIRLPDLRGRTPIGSGQGINTEGRPLSQRQIGARIGSETFTLTSRELPVNAYTFNTDIFSLQGDANALLVSSNNTVFAGNLHGHQGGKVTISNPTGGNATPIMQPSLVVNFIIKY